MKIEIGVKYNPMQEPSSLEGVIKNQIQCLEQEISAIRDELSFRQEKLDTLKQLLKSGHEASSKNQCIPNQKHYTGFEE